MGSATIIEKYKGTDFVSSNIYGSWWFAAVWAALALTAVVYLVRRRVRRPSAVLLHLSFAVIMLGALITHVTASHGTVRLRMGVPTDTYSEDNGKDGTSERKLPFTLRLNSFDIRYHEGTDAEADYVSGFTVTDGGKTTEGSVSMNKIFSYSSVRLYQTSYDSDRRGSVLSVNSDPYGIPVTYTGYALLFVSLVWMLLDPKGPYRRLFSSGLLKKGVLSLLAVMAFQHEAGAATVLPEETAAEFGKLNILYNNRICPLQTFAIDFTKKLCGKPRYKDYTPEQVLTGFIFWGDEWSREPLLRVKSGEMRDAMQLPGYCSVSTFFNSMMGGYIIGPYVREYYNGQNDAFHRQVADVDDRLMLVMNLRRGALLKVFPFTSGGKTTWYAPTDNIADTLVDEAHRKYMQNVFSLVNQEAQAGNFAHVSRIVGKMRKYQEVNAGASLPSSARIKAERMYNAVPFATVLFMLNLTMGLLMLFLNIYRMTARPAAAFPAYAAGRVLKWGFRTGLGVMTVSLSALTACLALRWVVSGTVPMSNGYETMLLMAWFVMLLSLAACRRFRIALTFGFLMSGFFLLVSHINQMDPQITHIMPVLSSPLLSIHVSVIMMSFALLSLTFICGLTAVMLRLARGRLAAGLHGQLDALRLLSDLFFYPALTALGIGIFIGAVWANVSWGTYWSWDAKEVWGLITLMIYAMAAHRVSLPFLLRPMGYHVFMVLAFLSVVMTYFGVNYFLGGMHSYA